MDNQQTVSRSFFWLADKCFTLHTIITAGLAILFCWGGLWVSAGVLVILWILTLAIWQEWKAAG